MYIDTSYSGWIFVVAESNPNSFRVCGILSSFVCHLLHWECRSEVDCFLRATAIDGIKQNQFCGSVSSISDIALDHRRCRRLLLLQCRCQKYEVENEPLSPNVADAYSYASRVYEAKRRWWQEHEEKLPLVWTRSWWWRRCQQYDDAVMVMVQWNMEWSTVHCPLSTILSLSTSTRRI